MECHWTMLKSTATMFQPGQLSVAIDEAGFTLPISPSDHTVSPSKEVQSQIDAICGVEIDADLKCCN